VVVEAAVEAVPRAPAVVVVEEVVVVVEAVGEVAVPQRRLHRQSGPRRN